MVLLFACALLGVLDFVSPPEVVLTAPFLVIISFAVWYGTPLHGFLVATFGVFTRFISERGYLVEHPALSVWNFMLEVSVLFGVALLASQFKTALLKEKALARNDALTGILSRRGFDELVLRELARSLRQKTTVSVALMDVDRFKKINDIQGHKAGDMLLQQLAMCLQKAVRNVDIVARWGGDEFVLLMPDTNQREAEIAILRIREKLAPLLELWDIGLSIGVSQVRDAGFETALVEADSRMYSSKRGLQAPQVGIEPTTSRLTAVRSAN